MRNSRILRLFTVALIGGGGISMLAASSGTVSADEPGGINVGLHNNTTDNVQTCSEVPGLDTPAWHFIAPGGSILEIVSLDLGDQVGYTPPLPLLQYPTTQHAYVTVPDGKTIESLDGGEFVVTGTDKVVLSHTCTGTITTTTEATTTTTTTQPTTTTATSQPTTSTEAPTTTEAATTTSTKTAATTSTPTTVPATLVPTTASASGGPTTAAPTTQVALATQLPATGGSSWTLFFVGVASALGGLGLIRISRRPV